MKKKHHKTHSLTHSYVDRPAILEFDAITNREINSICYYDKVDEKDAERDAVFGHTHTHK